MRNLRTIPRLGVALAAGAAALAIAGTPAHAAPGDGYVRLAHLSPDTPDVDVYLYSTGKKTPRLVLRHVGYGALSPYQRLGNGSYTVSMRPANAPATSKPVLSANVRVQSGGAYTVAGMGPYKGIKLDVLKDSASLPANRAGVRVIAASLKQPQVDVKAGDRTLTDGLRLANATPHHVLPAASTTIRVSGGSNAAASTKFRLNAGALYTVVVLDGPKGLRLIHLRDASQSAQKPRGGVDTGLGGLAEESAVNPWWFVAPGVLAGLGLATVVWSRRRANLQR